MAGKVGLQNFSWKLKVTSMFLEGGLHAQMFLFNPDIQLYIQGYFRLEMINSQSKRKLMIHLNKSVVIVKYPW